MVRLKFALPMVALIIGSSAFAVEASAQGHRANAGGAAPMQHQGPAAPGPTAGGAMASGRTGMSSAPAMSTAPAPMNRSSGNPSPGRSFGSAAPSVQTGSGAFAGRSFRHDRGGRGWIGPAAGFAAGAAIGGAVTGDTYGNDYAYDDYGYPAYGYAGNAYSDYGYADEAPVYDGEGDVADCVARYRSYDRATGTYLGYDGLRHSCP
jgi:hypothetical protein